MRVTEGITGLGGLLTSLHEKLASLPPESETEETEEPAEELRGTQASPPISRAKVTLLKARASHALARARASAMPERRGEAGSTEGSTCTSMSESELTEPRQHKTHQWVVRRVGWEELAHGASNGRHYQGALEIRAAGMPQQEEHKGESGDWGHQQPLALRQLNQFIASDERSVRSYYRALDLQAARRTARSGASQYVLPSLPSIDVSEDDEKEEVMHAVRGHLSRGVQAPSVDVKLVKRPTAPSVNVDPLKNAPGATVESKESQPRCANQSNEVHNYETLGIQNSDVAERAARARAESVVALRAVATQRLQDIDSNRDGVADKEEFLGAGGSREEFDQYDLSRDGVLDASDLELCAVAKDKFIPRGLDPKMRGLREQNAKLTQLLKESQDKLTTMDTNKGGSLKDSWTAEAMGTVFELEDALVKLREAERKQLECDAKATELEARCAVLQEECRANYAELESSRQECAALVASSEALEEEIPTGTTDGGFREILLVATNEPEDDLCGETPVVTQEALDVVDCEAEFLIVEGAKEEEVDKYVTALKEQHRQIVELFNELDTLDTLE